MGAPNCGNENRAQDGQQQTQGKGQQGSDQGQQEHPDGDAIPVRRGISPPGSDQSLAWRQFSHDAYTEWRIQIPDLPETTPRSFANARPARKGLAADNPARASRNSPRQDTGTTDKWRSRPKRSPPGTRSCSVPHRGHWP